MWDNTIHPAALYCTMGIAGYVSVCVQLYCVGFHCPSLHISAYMAIFRCDHPKKCSKRKKSREAESFKRMKINIRRVLHTWRWPCRPKHVVKDSENQHNKAVHRRKHNLQYPWMWDVKDPTLLDNRLTAGAEAVRSYASAVLYPPRNIFFSYSRISLCYMLIKP
jgi:hypothetical protein